MGKGGRADSPLAPWAPTALGVTNHLLNVCRSSASKFKYLQIQFIEKVSVQNDDDIDKVLWEREKYWEVQLFYVKPRIK